MAGKKTTVGSTGKTVSENIRRIRESKNMPYAELSRRLEALECPIPELGLRNIERGQRKVDTDELVALAIVLKTTPAFLLMHDTKNMEDLVELPGHDPLPAIRVWDWITGAEPIPGGAKDKTEFFQATLQSQPAWRIELLEQVFEMSKDKDFPLVLNQAAVKLFEKRQRANGDD